MEKIRSFIAIEVGDVIRAELARIQEELKPAEADVKWVRPGNIHLTLKFLGNVGEGRIGEIKAIIDKTVAGYGPFKMSLFRIGCFPKLEYPRVVWVGIDAGCSVVEEIATKLEDELEKVGFEKEKRKFSAHLTLGRVQSGKNREGLVHKIKALEVKSGAETTVSELVLFKSTLRPEGSIYTPLVKGRFLR